jgi:hypothetical protein
MHCAKEFWKSCILHQRVRDEQRSGCWPKKASRGLTGSLEVGTTVVLAVPSVGATAFVELDEVGLLVDDGLPVDVESVAFEQAASARTNSPAKAREVIDVMGSDGRDRPVRNRLSTGQTSS